MATVTTMTRSLATALVFLFTAISGRRSFAAANIVQYDFTLCKQAPTLHCKNGSRCTPGVANFGKQHDHLDLQEQDNGYHCKCKDGFIGHECEVQVDECADESASGVRSCYHGSKCQKDGNSFSCDCEALNEATGSTEAKFAGSMCQHESTSFCAGSLVGNSSPNHQFCTNHGKCVKMVMAGEVHPGCECTDGWMGDHCEIRRDPFAVVAPAKEGGGNGTASKVLFSLLIIAIVAVASGIAFVFVKGRKRGAFDTSGAVFQGEGETPGDKVVGLGDLDADGTGTLGSESPIVSPSTDENGVRGSSDNEVESTAEDDAEHTDSDSAKVGPQTEIV